MQVKLSWIYIPQVIEKERPFFVHFSGRHSRTIDVEENGSMFVCII